MNQKIHHRTSFAVDQGTLKLVDDFAARNDLNRSQTIRRALRMMIASEGVEPANGTTSRPRAPRPQPRQNA
jgi:hypothetical protein